MSSLVKKPPEKDLPDRYFYYTEDTGILVKIDTYTNEVVGTSGDFTGAHRNNAPVNPMFCKGTAPVWVYNTMYRDIICQKVAEGETLTAISKGPGFPSSSIIAKWRREHEDFQEMFIASKKMRAELHHDKIVDALENIQGMHKDDIPAEKLYIDTNKWLAEKNDPQMYGNKLMHEGESNAPVTMVINTGVPESASDKDTIELDKEDFSESKEKNSNG